METVVDRINKFLYDVDATWRFLRQGDVASAQAAAMSAERRHDELLKEPFPKGVSYKFIGNLIVGVKA